VKSITLHETSIKKFVKNIDREIANGFTPSLAFIYISPLFNIEKLMTKLSHFDFLIVGCTTAGEVYANEVDGACEVEGGIVAMLLDIDPNALALTVIEVEGKDSYVVGEHVGLWAKSNFLNASIITLTSGLTFDNDAYTQGIVSKRIEYVFGGAAADDLKLEETFVFSNHMLSNNGVVALVIDRDIINIIGARAFGWGGIGKARIVTKASKNIVYEIDGMPAVEFYKRYLDVESSQLPQIGIEYPLEVQRRNGDVIYRAILDFDEEKGALIFAGHVEEKSQVRISAPKGKSIIKEVENSALASLEEHPEFTPQVALVFPCCSRKQVLGYLTRLEIEAITKVAKVPLIGFFAYGEIGAFPGGYGFHNETFVTAFLEERVKE